MDRSLYALRFPLLALVVLVSAACGKTPGAT
ncbi:Efflux transporter periplasmic adaptor subunit OS=Stutzerimonas stutzeri OX=316 GN=CXK95_09220 PE=3 SV=1 [Stutzerimonas stutzeri]